MIKYPFVGLDFLKAIGTGEFWIFEELHSYSMQPSRFGFKMTPAEFELRIKKALENSLKESGFKPKVRHRQKLTSASGNIYEIDLCYEFTVAGIKYLTLVECKYWNSKVGRNKINEFKAVVEDLKAHKGIIISLAGFQRGAITYGKSQGIELFRFSDGDFIMYCLQPGDRDPGRQDWIQPVFDSTTALVKLNNKILWNYIRTKYGFTFASFLRKLVKNPRELASPSLKIPSDVKRILTAINSNWSNEFKQIETSGLTIIYIFSEDLWKVERIINTLRVRLKRNKKIVSYFSP